MHLRQLRATPLATPLLAGLLRGVGTPSAGLTEDEQQELSRLIDNALGHRPQLDEEGISILSNRLADDAGRYIARLCKKREQEQGQKQGSSRRKGFPSARGYWGAFGRRSEAQRPVGRCSRDAAH